MPASAHPRLTRYAVLSVAHAVVVLLALTGLAGPDPGLVVLVASVPLFFAWGAYQADVALNPWLTEPERQRWRLLLWVLPWSMTAYWHRHVRPRSQVD